MNRIKTTLVAAISIALAFTFFACGEVEGDFGGGSSKNGACKMPFMFFWSPEINVLCIEFTADKQTTYAGAQLTSKEFCEEGWFMEVCEGNCSGEVDENGEPICEIEECYPGSSGEYLKSCSNYTLKCSDYFEVEVSNIDNNVYFYGEFFEGKKCEDLK
jgi:hypothetical protein